MIALFKDIRNKIPADAYSVQVKDRLSAEKKYKIPKDIEPDDQVCLNTKGLPIVMMTSPGEAHKKVEVLAPPTKEASALLLKREEHMDADNLLQIIRADPGSVQMLDEVLMGLAEEQSSISFERKLASVNGKPTSELAMRRSNILKSMADTWLKRKEQVTTRGVDMTSPAYNVFIQEVLMAFKDALTKAGHKDEAIEVVFASLAAIMNDSWQTAVKIKMDRVT